MLTNDPALSHEDIKRCVKEGRRLRSTMGIGVATRTAKSVRQVIARPVTLAINATRRLCATIARTHWRDATVNALAALDDRTLKDIGLHRSEIRSAVGELFGDAPRARVRGPALTARTGTLENAGVAANDESFVQSVSEYR